MTAAVALIITLALGIVAYATIIKLVMSLFNWDNKL